MTALLLRVDDLTFVRKKENWRFMLFLDRLVVHPGDQRALIGPSGSGKSTLLDILAMVLRPATVGQFVLQGRDGAVDVAGAWAEEELDQLADLRAGYTGYILQQGGLLNYLTVGENIALPLRLLHLPVDRQWIAALARHLRIDQYLDRRPNQLSVGERQRAGIARAVVHRPRVIFADEPTASVDAANALAVAKVLLDVARELGSALVVATHDIGLVDRLKLTPMRLDVSQERGGTVSHFSEM